MKTGIGAEIERTGGVRAARCMVAGIACGAIVALVPVVRSPGAEPVLLGKYPASGSSPNLFYGVALSGGEAYSVTYGYTNANGGLRVLVGTSPPIQERATGAIDGFRKVEVGTHAHVLWSYSAAGNWRSGIRIFNTASLSEYDTDDRLFWIGTRAQGLDLEGNTLYVASDDGLIIVDVTDPDVEPGQPTSGPHILGTYAGVTAGYDVDVVGGVAYVADGTAGLKIVNVSNPAAPVLLGTWLPGGGKSVRGVFVGANAIACAVGEGFWTADVSNPGSPATLGALDEDADRVVASGGCAYVAGYGGLRAYDISDAAHPVLDGRHMTPYRAEDVAYAAPFIYLADRSGLIVLRHGTAPALILTLVADPEIGRTPLDVRLTADVSGGAPGYFYDWFVDGLLVYSGEESFLDHTFTTSDMHMARVTVTDASGKVASAAAAVDARGPKARIYGAVRTADTGEPIGNASVSAQGPGGVLAAAATVNPAGDYSFDGLAAAIYSVTASAPDCEPVTRAIALRHGVNLRVDFGLAGLLTESARKKKEALISALSAFPGDARDWEVGDAIEWIASNANVSGPALSHPYADAEQLTATWLGQQTSLTEALQRITLAEAAFKLMAEDAVIYGNFAGEYFASTMGLTLDLIISLLELDEFIEEKLWFLDVQGLLIKKYIDTLSFSLFLDIAKWTGERATKAARDMFKEALGEAIGTLADDAEIDVNQFVFDWKARFANYWAQYLIEEYGRTTEPLLTTALDKAIAGPPYELDYGDSKAIVLNELRATAAKREAVVRAQGNIDVVADEIFGRGAATFSFLHTILEKCEMADAEAGLARATEILFSLEQIYANAANAKMALDRLRVGLPQEAANAVYWSFGATPPTFPPPAGGGAPAAMAPMPAGDGPVGLASMSLPVPSSSTARAALTGAHALLVATNLAAYTTTLTNAVIPATDAYLHDAAIFNTAATFHMDPDAEELEEIEEQLGWCHDSYHYVLAASLELHIHDAAGNPPDAPGATALREKLLDQIATLIATLDSADRALGAADLATEGQPEPGPILAIARLSASNADGRPLLPPAPGKTLDVTAQIVSVGSSNAAGVDASLELAPRSNLALAGGSLTVPLPSLAAGTSTNVTWTLACAGAGHRRFELLTCSLVHRGGDTNTAIPQGPGFLVIPGPYYPDSDGDGMGDDFETDNGLDPNNAADAQGDADGDTLTNLEEFLRHTNPNSPDSDGDGCGDTDEIDGGYNPFVAASHPIPPPPCDQIEISMCDAAGPGIPLLRARMLKPDPETPITIQGSTNLIDWEDILVYSNAASGYDPAVFECTECEHHYELLFDVPGLLPRPPRAAFYRMRWEVPPEPPPRTLRITMNPGNDLQPSWHPTQQIIAYIACWQSHTNAPNLGHVISTGTNEHLMATGPTQGQNGLVHSLCWRGASSPHMPEVLVEERVGTTREYLEFLPDADPWQRTVLDGSDSAFDRRLRIDGGGAGGCIRGSRDGSTIAWRYSTSPDGTGNIALRAGPLNVFHQYASTYGTAFLTSSSATGELLDRGFGLNANGTVAVVSRKSGSGRDLYLHNTNGTGTPTRLTTSGQASGAFNEWPEFSANGARIAFTFRESASAHSDIAVVQADGSGFTNVTRSPDWDESHPTWRANGAEIGFERYDDASTGALLPGESANWNIHVIAAP